MLVQLVPKTDSVKPTIDQWGDKWLEIKRCFCRMCLVSVNDNTQNSIMWVPATGDKDFDVNFLD